MIVDNSNVMLNNVINLTGDAEMEPPKTNVQLSETPLSVDEIIAAIAQLSNEITMQRADPEAFKGAVQTTL